jgi:hypothetical protein
MKYRRWNDLFYIISPTGLGPRPTDDFGSGAFHASRGSRLHSGVDYMCVPGQDVKAPISGTITRESRPYGDKYSGCVLKDTDIQMRIWYFKFIDRKLIGTYVKQGDVIGTAQDISNKYNTKEKFMIPHIHVQIDWISPELLREEVKWGY